MNAKARHRMLMYEALNQYSQHLSAHVVFAIDLPYHPAWLAYASIVGTNRQAHGPIYICKLQATEATNIIHELGLPDPPSDIIGSIVTIADDNMILWPAQNFKDGTLVQQAKIVHDQIEQKIMEQALMDPDCEIDLKPTETIQSLLAQLSETDDIDEEEIDEDDDELDDDDEFDDDDELDEELEDDELEDDDEDHTTKFSAN